MTPPVTLDPAEPVKGLLEILDLKRIDDDHFEGPNVAMPGGRIFGGQVLAQALIAADRTVNVDRLPHSVHGYFLRPGSVGEPITFAVERLNDGRSFSTRRTHAFQHGLPILSMISSFQVTQPGLDHQTEMPSVPAPETVTSALTELGGIDLPIAQFWSNESPFDIRHIDGSLFLGSREDVTDRQLVWLRARGPLPQEPTLHAAALAYICDQMMLEPILRAHGESWASPGISVASLDHAMWWHRPLDLNDWVLLEQASPTAQGGRGLATSKVYSTDGRLVASIAQEGMVRTPRV